MREKINIKRGISEYPFYDESISISGFEEMIRQNKAIGATHIGLNSEYESTKPLKNIQL